VRLHAQRSASEHRTARRAGPSGRANSSGVLVDRTQRDDLVGCDADEWERRRIAAGRCRREQRRGAFGHSDDRWAAPRDVAVASRFRTGTHPGPDPDTHANSDAYADPNTNTNPDACANPDTDADADADTDADTHADADTDADTSARQSDQRFGSGGKTERLLPDVAVRAG